MLLSVLRISVFFLSFFQKWRVLRQSTREVARSLSYCPSWSGELRQAEPPVGATSAREGTPFLQPEVAAARGLRLWLLHAPQHRGWHGALLSAFPPCQAPTLQSRDGKAPTGKELHCRVGSNVLDAIWLHWHTHAWLTGRGVIWYMKARSLFRNKLCDELKYHVANIFWSCLTIFVFFFCIMLTTLRDLYKTSACSVA